MNTYLDTVRVTEKCINERANLTLKHHAKYPFLFQKKEICIIN